MEQTEFEAVLDGISEGASMSHALELFGYSRGAFWRALDRLPTNRGKYARARELQVEGLAEDCITIADTDPDPQRARNRIQVRQHYAGKMNPGRFGDKLDLTVTEKIDPAAAHGKALARIAAMRGPLTIDQAETDETSALTSNPLIAKAP